MVVEDRVPAAVTLLKWTLPHTVVQYWKKFNDMLVMLFLLPFAIRCSCQLRYRIVRENEIVETGNGDSCYSRDPA